MTLHRHDWARPVAKTSNLKVVDSRLETQMGVFELVVLRDLLLTQTAALALLEGESLATVFDKTFLVTNLAARTVLPFLLVGADMPKLASSSPSISKVALVRVKSLTRDDIEVAALRAHLFHTIVERGLFHPGVEA